MSRRLSFTTAHASEDSEQESFFRWLAVTRWRTQPLTRWYFAIPNGGSRHPLEAMKLKRCGVKAGVLDVLGIIPIGRYSGHFVEMKAHGGRLRPEQRDFIEIAQDAGYRTDVCFGWEEASKAVERYLGRESTVQERLG